MFHVVLSSSFKPSIKLLNPSVHPPLRYDTPITDSLKLFPKLVKCCLTPALSGTFNVSLIEIFGRTDCCPNRNKLRVDLYDDSVSKTNVVWTTKIDDMLYDAHKAIKITN